MTTKPSKRSSKSSFALTPLAAAVVTALTPTLPVIAQEESARLDEVIVTATKREIDLQDVPHSIDVLSQIELERMGAMDLESTVRALPSVHLTALQPGQNQLTMRGVTAEVFEYSRDALVAVYLDEQPMTSNAQQIGFRNIDMERVESLPGPQGTLFGSSSQTGTIRYISKKPNTSQFEAEIEGSWATTQGGADSYDLAGMLNFPLIDDKLAVRLVGYSSHDGGYVDNVFGTSFTGNYDNAEYVKENHNEYDVDGGRLHVQWDMTENWSTLISLMAEQTSAPGAWDSDAALDDYQVTRFFDEFRDDDWTSASITLNGDLGFADLTFTATRFDRDIVYEYDQMAYSQSRDRLYKYDCVSGYYGYNYYYPFYCLYYANYYHQYIFNDQIQERDAYEFRLVSKGDTRFQWMVGAYYEDFLNEWFYGNKIPGMENTTMWYAANFYAYYYGVSSNYYNNYTPNPYQVYPLPETDYAWTQNFTQTIKQTAFFGEFGYDLTDKLNVFGGVRWAEFERDKIQTTRYVNVIPFPDRGTGGNGSFRDVGVDDDIIYKFGLQYDFNDDFMGYALYSQGFRVGGANSVRAASSGLVPLLYDGDFLNNYEFGFKSTLLDGRVSLNASAFFMVWEDYQQGVSGDAWWNGGTINAGEARIDGLEVSMRWQMTDRLLFSTTMSFNHNEFQDDFCTNFVDNVNLGCEPGIEPRITAGMTMPNAPDSKFFASIYYEIPDVLGGELWLYYDYAYQAESWSGIDEIRNSDLDGLSPARNYSTLSAGLQLPNQLDITLNIANLFNSNGYTYVWTGEGGSADSFGSNRYQQQRAQDRPRTVWFTLKKGFGGR